MRCQLFDTLFTIFEKRIFVASSVEGLSVAYAVQELLEHNAECTVWNQGVFDPSSYTMSDLIERLKITVYGYDRTKNCFIIILDSSEKFICQQ